MEFSALVRTRPWAFLAAFLLGVAGLVLGTVLSLVVLVPLVLLNAATATVLIVVSLVMTQGVAFGGTALTYLKVRGLPFDYLDVHVPDLRDVGWAVGGYVLALVSAIVGIQIVTGITQQVAGNVEPATNSAAQLGMQNPGILLLLIPASFLLIGPGEELLFRGIVQNRIRESFGPVAGVLLASAIFAAIHVTALVGSPTAMAMSIAILLFPSLVFGTVYELSRNLAVTAFMHGAYNATLFAGLYYTIA